MTMLVLNVLYQIICDVPILCVGISISSVVTLLISDDTPTMILISHIVPEQIITLNHKQWFLVVIGFIKPHMLALIDQLLM